MNPPTAVPERTRGHVRPARAARGVCAACVGAVLLALGPALPVRAQTEDPLGPLFPPVENPIDAATTTEPPIEPVQPIEDEVADNEAGADVVRRALETPSSEPSGEAPIEASQPSAADETTSPPEDGIAEPVVPLDAEATADAAADTEAATQAEHDQLSESRDALEGVEESAADENIEIQIPEPCTGPWDWVQYSSGEWLRGEFKRMRKKRFEMRSTRFDRRTTDWKHIRAFCFAESTRFILYDHTVLVGKGTLEKGVLTVVGDDITQEARRGDIWAILPGAPREINRWRSKVTVGIDTSTGNTDTAGVTGTASIDREDPSTHFHVDYTGTFNATDGETIAARHRVNQAMNVYFTRRLYASLPFVDYTSDRFQNLQNRVVPGLSLGWKFFDDDTIEWSVDGGLAYQFTQYVSVAADQNLTENDWGPRISSSLDWTIVKNLDLVVDHNTVILRRDSGQTNFHTKAALSYEITDLLFIELSVTHDRIRDPRENADGTTPEKDDLRYVFSLGLNFD